MGIVHTGKDTHWFKRVLAMTLVLALVIGMMPMAVLAADEWTVTFESDGGSEVDEQSVDHDGLATEPDPAPTKLGYEFDGWSSDEDPDAYLLYDFSNTRVVDDLTLYAKWTEVGTYAVTYYANNGDDTVEPAEVLVTVGEEHVVLSNDDVGFTSLGYRFLGWSEDDDADAEDYAAGDTVGDAAMEDDVITLYAVWEYVGTYTVTYNANGGEGVYDPVEVTVGEEHAVLSNDEVEFTYEGYTFVGWAMSEDATEADIVTSVDGEVAADENIDLYAVWEPIPEPADKTELEAKLMDAAALDEADYTAATWAVFAEALADARDVMENEDATQAEVDYALAVLTAAMGALEEITVVPDTWTVTFMDGDKVVGTETVDEGETVTAPEMTKLGFVFAGWYTDKELTQVYYIDTRVTTDVTLYAKWTAVDTVKVTFMDGETVAKIMEVNKDEAVAALEMATRIGFVFDGWYTDAAMTQAYDFTAPVTADLTLYAKWTAVDTFKVTFMDGETEVGTVEVNKDGLLTAADMPVKPGYIFKGVYTDAAMTQAYDITTPVTTDLTLYTKWDEVGTYKVTYKANGGTGADKTVEVTTTTAHKVLTAAEAGFAREDFTFLGWSTKAEATTAEYAAGTEIGAALEKDTETTLYAVWQAAAASHVKYVNGYKDGSFGPDGNITRAEAAMMLYNLIEDAGKDTANVTSKFDDVKDTEAWFYHAVAYIADKGIITGYEDNTFRPDTQITRAEFVTMLARFHGLDITAPGAKEFPDMTNKEFWGYNAITQVADKGWVEGYEDGTFGPDTNITRAEAVTATNKSMNRAINKDNVPADCASIFSDVAPAQWFYVQIIEAATNHEYTRIADNTETWSSHNTD